MANKTLLLKRSSVVDASTNMAKAPTPEQLEYGELAINYASGYETLYAKNSDGEVIGVLINGTMQTVSEALSLHEARNDNPHGVTKEQVGLGNVDNTSDLDKPLSTATQEALSLKLDKTSIADNLTTNSSSIALSAAQGIVLKEMADEASGGVTADLSALIERIAAIEEEVENTEAIEDQIIAKENEIITEFSE